MWFVAVFFYKESQFMILFRKMILKKNFPFHSQHTENKQKIQFTKWLCFLLNSANVSGDTCNNLLLSTDQPNMKTEPNKVLVSYVFAKQLLPINHGL